jgi:signal transduction histidine kinase
MSTPVLFPGLFESWPFLKRRLQYGVVALVTLGAASALIWPSLTKRLFASNFLPHSFCYVGSQGLIWTHVLADFLIFLAYFAISATLVYLVYKGHREIPFHWMFLAFGLFIVACGATHLMEAITVWFPVYVLSGGVKIFTALASLTTAIILPFTVSQILSLVKAARASEVANDRLRLAMESGKSVGWDWDVKSGRDLWFGDLQTMFGIPSNTYSGHVEDFRRRIYPQDRGLVWKAVNDARMTKSSYSAEFRVLHAEGTLRWVAAKGTFYYLPNGEAMRMLGMAFDVTELKRTQEALRESEERLSLAVQAGRMYAFEWDAATDVIVRSGQCVDILNWMDDPTHDTGGQFLARVHPDDREAYAAPENGPSPENPTYQTSYRLLRPDGSAIWLEANGRVLFDDQGRILRIIGLVADVTNRKVAEDALSSVSRRLIEAHEEERTWIARELHDDINQRVALLAVELAQCDQHLPKSEAAAHGQIRHLGESLSDLGSDIHALSHRLHSSKLEHLGLVSAAGGFCKELSEQQNVEISFRHDGIPCSVPKEISLCLFRVLQEALQNAVKHSGMRNFNVELQGTSEEIQLTVSDQGVGFDPQGAIDCRGLGLISMRERLQLVGGEFSIGSKHGGGTTIRARVPHVVEQHRAATGG